MSKPCESGNANASDVTPQECFFEIEDDNGTKVLASPVAAKKTKSSSGKREIQEFLEKHEMEEFSLDRHQNSSVNHPAFEANQQRRKFYHTILCIDTSKSMKSSKLMTCCCIQQLLREIPEQNPEFEEVISVVCFGKYLRFYEYNPEDPAGHILFVNNELENHDRSWIGCTPLADACLKCIFLHTRVKDRLRRNTASVIIKGRVVMFTDGKCNSKRVLDNEDDENTNPLESMQDIYNHLNDLWTRFRTETLPIFCIISSYRDTDQNFLVSMAINTNGKVLLRDEISAFSKFIEVEILAARYKSECRGLNWHQVFAYLRIKLGHRECLYLDYATECILRENGESTLNVSNHNFLPRLIRRHPKQGIYGWQQKSQSGWVFFPNEISDEIEKGYSAWQLSKLQTFTIERHTENQEIDVLRFDLTNMTYRVIGNDGKIYIQRIFMGNDWG
uniref:VWFA domain-containing protein n=1 Tax=Magallana gigas TaxID=29159 RepID=A0A8W8MEP1_MAGGI